MFSTDTGKVIFIMTLLLNTDINNYDNYIK